MGWTPGGSAGGSAGVWPPPGTDADAPPRQHLPPGWVAVDTPEGEYYWNEETNETRWELPQGGSVTV